MSILLIQEIPNGIQLQMFGGGGSYGILAKNVISHDDLDQAA